MTYKIYRKLLLPLAIILVCIFMCVVVFSLFFDQYDTASDVAELFQLNEQYFQECQTVLEAQSSISYISFSKLDVELTISDYLYEENGIYFFSADVLDKQSLISIAEVVTRLNEHVPLKDITIRHQPLRIEFNIKARNILNTALIVYSSSGEPIEEYMHDTVQINSHWFSYITGD